MRRCRAEFEWTPEEEGQGFDKLSPNGVWGCATSTLRTPRLVPLERELGCTESKGRAGAAAPLDRSRQLTRTAEVPHSIIRSG